MPRRCARTEELSTISSLPDRDATQTRQAKIVNNHVLLVCKFVIRTLFGR